MPSSQIGLFNRQTKETCTRDKTAPWGWPKDTQSVVDDQPPTKVSPDVIHDVLALRGKANWQNTLRCQTIYRLGRGPNARFETLRVAQASQ